jgi:hypothetical protein
LVRGSISVSPQSLLFTDATGGKTPPTQKITLTAYTVAGGAFTASSSSPWISIQPTSGIVTANHPKEITVTANPGSLPIGNHYGSIAINLGTFVVTVDVTLITWIMHSAEAGGGRLRQ